jgi:hypothetical protein
MKHSIQADWHEDKQQYSLSFWVTLPSSEHVSCCIWLSRDSFNSFMYNAQQEQEKAEV